MPSAPSTIEFLDDSLRSLPSHGSDWDAAIEFGIDVTLIERNLTLTPTERLLQLEDMLATFHALRP